MAVIIPKRSRPSYSEVIFKGFHPLDDAVPDEYWDLRPIAARARALLTNRTYEEICSMADLLGDIRAKAQEMLSFYAIEEMEKTGAEEFFLSPALALYNLFLAFNENGKERYPQETWPEYFAVYALMQVAEANYDIENPPIAPGFSKEPYKPDVRRIVSDYALTGTEIICYAESLAGKLGANEALQNVARRLAKEEISSNARRAANKRHSPKNDLKQEFIAYALSRPQLSQNEAARRFYRNLPKERRTFAETNAVRTLTDALREYKKKNPDG